MAISSALSNWRRNAPVEAGVVSVPSAARRSMTTTRRPARAAKKAVAQPIDAAADRPRRRRWPAGRPRSGPRGSDMGAMLAARIAAVSRPEHADVVIVGGAIIGSSVATFLALHARTSTAGSWSSSATRRSAPPRPRSRRRASGSSSARRSTSRSAASGSRSSAPGPIPRRRRRGARRRLRRERLPLPATTDAGLATLERNHAVQAALDVPVVLLSPAELGARFGWLHTDDLAGASLGLRGRGLVRRVRPPPGLPAQGSVARRHRASSARSSALERDGDRSRARAARRRPRDSSPTGW